MHRFVTVFTFLILLAPVPALAEPADVSDADRAALKPVHGGDLTIRMQGDPESYANFLSQNAMVDDAVGRVRAALQKRGLAEETVDKVLGSSASSTPN